jgi:hypothetical protein
MKKIHLRVIGAVATVGVAIMVLCAGCIEDIGIENENGDGDAAKFLREFRDKAE